MRRGIDRLDEELVRLLNERMLLVEEIGAAKRDNGLPVTDAARERDILARLHGANRGPLPDEALDEIWREVFSAAKQLERASLTAYLGPEATFTHLAAQKHLGRSAALVPCRSVRDVFRAVEKGECSRGVVPVENSTEGTVTHTLDMLLDTPLPVTDEIYLEVHHHLLSAGDRLDRVKVIFSHPQAIAQCQEWLRDKAAGIALVEVPSTAEAARRALESPGAAAIASELAAVLYGLTVVARRIEDRFDNLTRFLVVGGEEHAPTGRDKTSLAFSITDQVGALDHLLGPLARAGINLTKIESRPSRRKAWDYVFFVDLEGHRSEPRVAGVLGKLRRQSPFFKVLGSYPNRARDGHHPPAAKKTPARRGRRTS